jgi:hypothetical protein
MATTVWVAAEPDTTAIKVMFYDRRNDPNNLLLEVSTGTSFDRGSTWQYTLWASQWSVPALLCPQNFDCGNSPCHIGDYNGLSNLFPNSVAFIGVWGDSRGTASGTPCRAGDPTESQDPDIRFTIGC